MKNLKNMLGLLVVSTLGFVGTMNVHATTVSSPDSCSASDVAYVKFDTGYGCYSTLVAAANAIDESGTITLSKSVTLTNALTITDKDIVLDLNGKILTLGGTGGTIGSIAAANGTNLTIKNGYINFATSTATSTLTLNATSNDATLTIDDSVKVDGTNVRTQAVIGITNSTNNNVEVNIGGEWTNLGVELVDCAVSGKETINLNAKVSGTGQLVGIDAGKSVVNVLGGSYTTTSASAPAFELKSGTLNITGGTISATKSSVATIKVDGSRNAHGENIVLNISDGTISSSKSYSMSIADAYIGKFAISGGNFTSSGDKAAISISDIKFLDEQSEIITGGSFTNGIVEDTKVGTVTYDVEEATKVLVGNSKITNENGVVTVGTEKTEDPGTEDPGTTEPNDPNVGDDNKPNTGDNQPSENPKTFDAIGNLVTMAISSLGVVGTTIKKVLK